jgi:hypothetical protein
MNNLKSNMIGLKYSTRIVILFDNIVIKIPLSKRGYLQGLNEKVIWDKYKSLNLLAELKWMYFGIICQKRYSPVKRVPIGAVQYAKELIPEFDFDNCDLYKAENWGIINKEYILLDYGINENISKLY